MGKVVGLQFDGNGGNSISHAVGKTVPYAQYEALKTELEVTKAELAALKAGSAKSTNKSAKGNKATNGGQTPVSDATQDPEKEGGNGDGTSGTAETPPTIDE